MSGLGRILEYIVFLTVDNCVRSIAHNLIDELVTKSLADVGGSPEQADWDATLEESVGTWTDTGTGSYDHHAAEHRSNP